LVGAWSSLHSSAMTILRQFLPIGSTSSQNSSINTRLTAGLQQKTGGFEVVVVDHGPHVNLMGKDVPGIPDYKIGGLSVKGAEFNYEVTSTTVKKVWLPTYIERIPGVSGDIARQYLNNVKEFRNRYFKKNR